MAGDTTKGDTTKGDPTNAKKLVTESNTSLNLGPQGRDRRLVEKVFQPKKLKKIIGVFNTYPLENQVKGVVPNIWTEREAEKKKKGKKKTG